MIPETQTLLFCLVFLCRPQEALLSLRGRCSKNEICSFTAVVDFKGAEGFCSQYDGELYKFSSEDNIGSLTSLLSGSSGKYWLQSADGTGPNCSAVSVMEGQDATVVRVPCQDGKLDGFFCKVQGVCVPVRAPGASAMTYTFEGFKFDDSEAFPAGAIAVAQKAGSKDPDSKHLCYTEWFKAPWRCEVMRGGCQNECISGSPNHCACPPGQHLHHNNISCTGGPRAESGRECQQVGENFACKCNKGYRLDQDGKSCVDVDECKEDGRCRGGQVCVNTQGSYECRCKEHGYFLEEGVCVNVAICKSCEHDCVKISGEYRCACRDGFTVSPSDPTRCNQNCTERDCRCVSKDGSSCECPDGYIKDTVDGKVFCTDFNECEAQMMCDHMCENLYGDYRCSCHEGFQLQGKDKCVRPKVEKEEDDDGSGSSPPWIPTPSTPAGAHPASLPSYIKTGSVLGITVFIVLAAGLLAFLLRYAFKRCGKFELSSLKRPDIDIFYLQQVTTETYKRLSFDKQFKSDSQKLELNQ